MIETSKSTRKNVKHKGVMRSQSCKPVTHSSLSGAGSLLETDMVRGASGTTTSSAVLCGCESLAALECEECFSLGEAGRGADIAVVCPKGKQLDC